MSVFSNGRTIYAGQVENEIMLITGKGLGGGGGIEVTIKCDRMELAADVVQDMAKFLHVVDLESEVDFAEEMAVFEQVSRDFSHI